MRQKIDLFLPCEDLDVAQEALLELHDNKTVQHINLLVSADFAASHQVPDGCTFIVVDRLESSNTVSSIAENTDADYVIICTKATPIRWGLYALERFLRTADDTGAVMVYSDHYSVQEGKLEKHPVIDYQAGSLRDDFDFGSLWLVKAQNLLDYAAQQDRQDKNAVLSRTFVHSLLLFKGFSAAPDRWPARPSCPRPWPISPSPRPSPHRRPRIRRAARFRLRRHRQEQ